MVRKMLNRIKWWNPIWRYAIALSFLGAICWIGRLVALATINP